mmetsp:Transcript_16151/g.41889  ORF Transcript_16151/g.41889 Transcript_16151/m.41889 type:complete len:105 (+) Transcript_16151:641-955(+)
MCRAERRSLPIHFNAWRYKAMTRTTATYTSADRHLSLHTMMVAIRVVQLYTPSLASPVAAVCSFLLTNQLYQEYYRLGMQSRCTHVDNLESLVDVASAVGSNVS